MVLLIASDDREGVMVHPDRRTVASTVAFSQIVMVEPPVVETSRTNQTGRMVSNLPKSIPRERSSDKSGRIKSSRQQKSAENSVLVDPLPC